MPLSIPAVRESFATLRRGGKGRHRDIAEQLGLSEGELIAAHVEPAWQTDPPLLGATRLRADWPALIAALEPLGEVMALTRNTACVHEKTGVYRGASQHGEVGLVQGGAIDLRLFYAHWAHGFALQERGEAGWQRSLQFFDAAGQAVHKIFLRPASDLAAHEALRARFAAADQGPGLSPRPGPAPEAAGAGPAPDPAAFREAWDGLRDTHDFVRLLERFGLARLPALRLAGAARAQPVAASACRHLLEAAAAQGTALMVFVGNPGAIQIHSGPVRRVQVMGPWLNVLDPGFNLHLREDLIDSAWIVRKPTVDGVVSSLEVFDAAGRTIAMLFGERHAGQAEQPAWRALLNLLIEETGPCTA